MSRAPGVAEMLRGFAVKLVLDRLAGERELPGGHERTRAKRGPKRRHRPAASPARHEVMAPVRRGPLFALMLACAGVAVPLMVVFEAPVTRIIGVLGLFGFIVCGVFLIADPAFLAGEDEEGGTA